MIAGYCRGGVLTVRLLFFLPFHEGAVFFTVLLSRRKNRAVKTRPLQLKPRLFLSRRSVTTAYCRGGVLTARRYGGVRTRRKPLCRLSCLCCHSEPVRPPIANGPEQSEGAQATLREESASAFCRRSFLRLSPAAATPRPWAALQSFNVPMIAIRKFSQSLNHGNRKS